MCIQSTSKSVLFLDNIPILFMPPYSPLFVIYDPFSPQKQEDISVYK